LAMAVTRGASGLTFPLGQSIVMASTGVAEAPVALAVVVEAAAEILAAILAAAADVVALILVAVADAAALLLAAVADTVATIQVTGAVVVVTGVVGVASASVPTGQLLFRPARRRLSSTSRSLQRGSGLRPLTLTKEANPCITEGFFLIFFLVLNLACHQSRCMVPLGFLDFFVLLLRWPAISRGSVRDL